MRDSFVYCWTDTATNRIYVGAHKGSIDDGYVSSSKVLNEIFKERSQDFIRTIVAHGTFEQMRKFETAILVAADAAHDDGFYNRSNSNGRFFCNKHSEETRNKMSKTWKRKGVFNCDHEKAINARRGGTITEEHRQKLSESRKGIPTRLGRKSTDESRRKLSETRKRMFAEGKLTSSFQTNNPSKKGVKRKPHSEETRKKISESRIRYLRSIVNEHP